MNHHVINKGRVTNHECKLFKAGKYRYFRGGSSLDISTGDGSAFLEYLPVGLPTVSLCRMQGHQPESTLHHRCTPSSYEHLEVEEPRQGRPSTAPRSRPRVPTLCASFEARTRSFLTQPPRRHHGEQSL